MKKERITKDGRPESAAQFDLIFADHHDPDKKVERKLLDNRKKREENIKNDLAI